MQHHDLDTWVDQSPAFLSPHNDPSIQLLPSDPYANATAEAALPFRSTTYTAKCVASAPFEAGSVYLQSPSDGPDPLLADGEPATDCPTALEQLYARGYRAHLRMMRAEGSRGIDFLTAPPDFDGSAPTNPEAVAQHVRGLAKVYGRPTAEPAPFDMHRYIIDEAVNDFTARHADADAVGTVNKRPIESPRGAERVSRATSAEPGDAADDENQAVDDDGEGEGLADALAQHYAPPSLKSEAFALAMSLSTLQQHGQLGVQVISARLRADTRVARLVGGAVVARVLDDCEEMVASDVLPLPHTCEVLSLAGTLVTARGRIDELLRYLGVLENFQQESWNIVPAAIPHAGAIVAGLTFDTKGLCAVQSPIDCLQFDPRALRVALAEGASPQCFCLSPDGLLLAVVLQANLAVYDTETGVLLGERPLSSRAAAAAAAVDVDGSAHAIMADSPSFVRASDSPAFPTPTRMATAGDAAAASVPGGSIRSNVKTLSVIHVAFTDDGTHIVATDDSATRHFAFPVDLSDAVEHVTDEPSLTLGYQAGAFELKGPPLLPSGCTTHAVLLQPLSRPLYSSTDRRSREPVEELLICAHVGSDFTGVLFHAVAESEELCVQVDRGAVTLVQSNLACTSSDAATAAPWVFLQVRWARGVWSLTVNEHVTELSGFRTSQIKSMLVKSIECVHGSGRVASCSVWTSAGSSRTAVRTFARERRLEAGVRALVHLPLDEGMGTWLKETVSGTCLSLPEGTFVWDSEWLTPCHSTRDRRGESPSSSPLHADLATRFNGRRRSSTLSDPTAAAHAASGHREAAPVCMDHSQLLGGQSLSSASSVYLLIPSAVRGSDDTVVQVDRATNVMVRVYKCPRSCAENLYSLVRDESELATFQPRFSTFSVAAIQTVRRREAELDRGATTGGMDPAACDSSSGLLLALYRRVYVECPQLYRIPLEATPLSTGNLYRLATLVDELSPMASPQRVAALLSLTLAHFEKLLGGDEGRVSKIAAGLKLSCGRLLPQLTSPLLRGLAATLLGAATRRSLTLQGKVDALLGASGHRSAAVLRKCVGKQALCAVVQRIVRTSPEELPAAAQRLISVCCSETQQPGLSRRLRRRSSEDPPLNNRSETDSSSHPGEGLSGAGLLPHAADPADGDVTATSLTARFAICSIAALHMRGRADVIARLLTVFVDFAVTALGGSPTSPLVSDDAPAAAAEQHLSPRSAVSVLIVACLPVFTAVAELCTDAVSAETAAKLLSLLGSLRGGAGLDTAAERVRQAHALVSFTTREVCDVYRTGHDPAACAWRLALDFCGATTVSVHKELSHRALFIVVVDPNRAGDPTVVEMAADRPFAKLRGGNLVLFGAGDSTFTVVAQYDIIVDATRTAFVSAAIRNVLMRLAARLTQRPPPGDLFIPRFMRHGLSTEALRRHGIDLPSREHASPLADSILNYTGEGKEQVDHILHAMRGSVVPSMRPAIQAIVAVLIHLGATVTEAEDELRLRWFSGDWGSKMQGPNRDLTRTYLRDLAAWALTSLAHKPWSSSAESAGSRSASTSMYRRSSAERRPDDAATLSMSLSERRGSMSSRRATQRATLSGDALEQIRALLSKEVSPAEIEAVLAQRTHTAMRIVRGLTLLRELLAPESAAATAAAGSPGATGDSTPAAAPEPEPALRGALRVLWTFADVDSGAHYLDSLAGVGSDIEVQVRQGFHAVLARCDNLLLGHSPGPVAPQAVLAEPAADGRATMSLLAILCHPWDAADFEYLGASDSNDHRLLQRLEAQMNIPTGNLTLTNPWRLRRDMKLDMCDDEERALRAELLGAADLNSLSHIFPNDFSVTIPQLETSRSDDGVILETNSGTTGMVVRADEGWPLVWREGVPRVLYFEVRAKALAENVEVGLLAAKADRGAQTGELTYFYRATGETHTVRLPSFGADDTVGCGVVTPSRRLFFTLNGKVLAFFGPLPDKQDSFFPALRFADRKAGKVIVNFGTAPFAYDFREQHPSISLAAGPTWYRVGSTAEMALHYLATRACAIQDPRRPSIRAVLTHCSEVVCRNVNKVTSSLMNVGIVGNPWSADSGTRIKQAVILAVAEYSLMILIATMRQLVGASGSLAGPSPDALGEMVFEAASVLMLLPLHSIQISTISVLPEVIPHVRRSPDGTVSANLVRTLFEHANKRAAADEEAQALIPFVPTWRECDPRFMCIANAQCANMNPGSQRSIVLGSPLPRTGVVSFTVRISRRGMSKGHSLKGGYFIGVSVAGLTPLSPTSNSQSWKAVKPATVWALHDTSPQLSHAANPTVKPNNFQRTFGNDDAIRVVLDRDRRTVDFYREGEFLKTLFSDLPADVALVPFVQLYNEDASVVICPGEVTAPISTSTLLSAASVDVLRAMLTLGPFQHLVAKGIGHELDTAEFPRVALAVFNSIPDPRVLLLRAGTGDGALVTVSRVAETRCKFSTAGAANYEHICNLRVPGEPKISCALAGAASATSLAGVQLCLAKIVAALRRLVVPLVTIDALVCLEQERRESIVEEEKDRWNFLFHGLRVSSYINIQMASQQKHLLTVPPIPTDFTFSTAQSHPNFSLPTNYCGRLATVPSGTRNVSPPFIAIAEPAVPPRGVTSIRCQLMRGHSGQILGGGYYFGVCSDSFNWRRKELNSPVPDVWAFHDMDDTPWRLRHMHPAATFPVTSEPRCVIVSGDIIRLEIDRSRGTMHAFRKPMNGDEVPLGLIFDKMPQDVELYPFVHLFNVDAVAVLLPSSSNEPALRLTTQQPHFASWVAPERKYCDGCAAAHSESKLARRWFKCNECADYALCKNCFGLCVHSHHAFTEMGVPYLAHSTAPPAMLAPGMKVVLPASNCIYLRSSGCRMLEQQINCVAESVDDNALAMWGLVCKQQGQFTAAIDTMDGEPLSTEQPMFIGVGGAVEIMQLSRDKLRGKCFAPSPSIATFSSDATLHPKMSDESRDLYGFQRGSTITMDIDLAAKTVSFRRDWIVVGTRSIDIPVADTRAGVPLCCFVAFGNKNTRVSVYPERSRTVLATIEGVNGSIVRVASVEDEDTGERAAVPTVRYVMSDNCRLPLAPCVPSTLAAGRLGYTYVGKELVQCEVAGAAAADGVRLQFITEGVVRTVAANEFLVDEDGAIARVRLVHKEDGEHGPTLECGFVISRLLLILSCMCENETLSPLVMTHCGELIKMLRSLASVGIGNEAPLAFLPEIRGFITSTANSLDATNRTLHLSPFVPSLAGDDRKRRFKPGMVVQRATDADPAAGAALRDTVYRVVSRRGDTLQVVGLDDEEARAELPYRSVIPVKQSGRRPWHTLDNGLPSSFLEHTERVAHDEVCPPCNVSIDGTWNGDIYLARSDHTSIELHLTSQTENATTSVEARPNWDADARAPRSVGVTVMQGEPPVEHSAHFSHARYGRVVHMCLIPSSCTALNDEFVRLRESSADPFPELVSRFINSSAAQAPRVYSVDVTIAAEGLRMSGVCRTSDGKAGAFAATWASRVTFAPLITDVGHIEPLPDCSDAVIPSSWAYHPLVAMRRLIVLLVRHLYLVLCQRTQTVSQDFVERIFLFHTHPLADRLAGLLVGAPNLHFMVSDACHHIIDPATRPWDVATLASLVTKTLLLRPETVKAAPVSLVLEALHAVVIASHRCGRYHRHEILRSVTAFMQQRHVAVPAAISAQLFAALFSYVDRQSLVATEVVETRKDVCAAVDLVLTVLGPLEDQVLHLPTRPLRCLVDIWQSLAAGRALPAVVDESVNCSESEAETAEVAPECAFGDFSSGELKVGKVASSCAAGSRGRYYYEVVLPDRLGSPFAVGWGTESHCDVPSQHVGSDRHSFSYNGTDMVTKDSKEEYKVANELMPRSVVGCLLDMGTKTVAWSVNGVRGLFVPFPIAVAATDKLYAFASISTCGGMGVHLQASQFEYVPDGYTDLSHRYSRVLLGAYQPDKRSRLAVQSINFYSQLALYLSDLDDVLAEATQSARPADASFAGNNSGSNVQVPAHVGIELATGRGGGGGGGGANGNRRNSDASPRSGSSSSFSAPSAIGSLATPLATDGVDAPAPHHAIGARSSRAPRAAAAAASTLSPTLLGTARRSFAGPDLASSLHSMAAASCLSPGYATSVTAEDLYLPKYQALCGFSRSTLEAHARVIAAIESCMATANSFVDLDGDAVAGDMSTAFVFLKLLVRRSFRHKLLINIPTVDKAANPTTIAIRVTDLYSTLPRTPEAALQHTVLSQLHRQIGAYTAEQWAQSPLFKVNLYISGSGHAPIDMGGPYRQLWTFVAEEMMRHPDKCFPHSDFHRNPLFIFANNSQRVALVPDAQATASCDLTLFNFLGKVMGHAARAKTPLDIDFSPFLWKFLVDEPLTVREYYQHVDSVVETSMQDDDFVLSGIAEEIIPGFADRIMWLAEGGMDDAAVARQRRTTAEQCLVHSMDAQLSAIRSGLWSILPRRVVRCLSWRDLEKMVCGESDPTVAEMRRFIRSNLSATRNRFFWQIVESMSAEQKASLLCFASGQRRLPLIRSITIQENAESVEHLPRAQSCSSLITIPPYPSFDLFRDKLLVALQHQAEMELA